MHTTNLRKVGGSVMLAVPPAILDLLRLEAGDTVALEIDGERLVVEPRNKPHYTLAELLESSDYSPRRSRKDRDWTAGTGVGREIL